jgi:hypothetical protein
MTQRIQRTTHMLTLDVDGTQREIEADVAYIYNRACRGARERGSGIQLEPDEPASVEIQTVTASGVDLTNLLGDSLLDALADAILEQYEETPA